jgi:hypothetical protein
MPEGSAEQNIHPSPLQIAADCIKLASDFRQLAIDYAKLLMECVEERRKTNERMDKLIAALIHSGVISRDPTLPPLDKLPNV